MLALALVDPICMNEIPISWFLLSGSYLVAGSFVWFLGTGSIKLLFAPWPLLGLRILPEPFQIIGARANLALRPFNRKLGRGGIHEFRFLISGGKPYMPTTHNIGAGLV